MFTFSHKKTDTKFGPPYAVFNLSKVGLRYFRIGMQVSRHSRDRIVAHAAAHPNVGWVFSAEGWFNLAIGFWARDNAEINDISSQIRAVLTPDDEIVFQSELTSLYSFGDRASTGQGSPMCIVDSAMAPIELAPLEVDYIKLLALDSSLEDGKVAEILGTYTGKVIEIKNSLTERGIIVGYQERIDYGSSHYKVFVDTLSRKESRAVEELTEKLWTDSRCIYFERANDKYDLEFEIILESKSALKEFLKDFSDYQAVVLTENLYTNLFPLNKTANLKEIQDSFIRQGSGNIDLRNSKLWYLNYVGAQAYLDINENRRYFEAMTKGELDLFPEAAAAIKQKWPGETFEVIDIGSGNGLKGRIFIEELGEKLVKAYFPVDIQPIELAATLKAHIAGKYAKHPVLLPIENLSVRFPLKLLPHERQVYIFFGGTYGNFAPEIINGHLKKILSESGAILISSPVVEYTNDESIIDSYATFQVEEMAFAPLSQVGFTKTDFERNTRHPDLIVEPVIEDRRLVTTFVLKRDVSISEKFFKKGDVFKLTTSWKPTFDEFKTAIERDFKAQFFQNGKFAIALIDSVK